MIAFCGMVCTGCRASLATKNDDDHARKQTVELWNKQFNVDLKPEDTNCQDGCLSDGEDTFGHCNVCKIRIGGREKGLENCAHCDEYACETLVNFFKKAPQVMAVLDEIRGGL